MAVLPRTLRLMPRYPEVQTFDHAAVECDVLERWGREGTFGQSLEIRRDAPPFVFYEGPPTANGRPGIHHVMARTVKDAFCRYQTMKGRRVERKGGWDTHGLPVEIEVEKELGLKGRHEVEAYGIARYNAACRRSVLRYKDLWDDLTRRMGYWVDLDHPYVTFDNAYIESVWNILQRIHAKGLLYRGHKIQWYSPANGTVLSSHEVSLGYREAQDPSVTVRFPLADAPGTSLLAWTTTPWTLPSNAALAVGPDTTYAKVRLPLEGGREETVLLAEARLAAVLKGEGEVVAQMAGRDLVGLRYTPPFLAYREALGSEAGWRVVAADYVTTDDGTGIVHTAPAFGADDYATAQREGLPTLNPITRDGRFDDTFPSVAGDWFKDADKKIARDLRERGLLFRHETVLHSYPHDWRKGTPLMQYPVESWFVRTTAVKERMIELNKTINWQPEGIGTGRFGQWLEGNVDWAISRMRFWGTPLPIWISDRDPEQIEVLGSLVELMARLGGTLPDAAVNPETGGLDLHRPFVDALTWPDGHGGTMRRVPDLLDVWFDSGAMPFAQWHLPFENETRFRQNFPADFIAEGVDQTRGWFYTLHAIATIVEDSVAYRNVIVNGLVLDERGEKMSKSKGNTVDPFMVIQTHGADPVRWTMMAASPPWENLRYADDLILETRRGFFGTLVNTYRFFSTYANLDGFHHAAAAPVPPAECSELDRWILSRLAATVEETDAALAAYHPTRAARAVERFVDDLSNWYVRRSRRRFWSKAVSSEFRVPSSELPAEEPATRNPQPATRNPQPETLQPDKQAAYQTLWTCLEATSRLVAPLAPFFAEWLFACLTGGKTSVHLALYPEADGPARDAELERRMALARALASAALALRNEAGINVRQPLGTLLVVTGPGGVDEPAVRSVEWIVRDEVNVKWVDTASSAGGLFERTARPNFRALGKRLGPRMKAAQAAIAALDADALDRYAAGEDLTLDLPTEAGQIAGEPFVLGAGDLEITTAGLGGQLVAQAEVDGGPGAGPTRFTVALDPTITDALRAEGLAREFVNRVQNLRKTAGYDVADRIVLTFNAPDATAAALGVHAEAIRNETLALTFGRAAAPAGDVVQAVELDGHDVTIGVRRIARDPSAPTNGSAV